MGVGMPGHLISLSATALHLLDELLSELRSEWNQLEAQPDQYSRTRTVIEYLEMHSTRSRRLFTNLNFIEDIVIVFASFDKTFVTVNPIL